MKPRNVMSSLDMDRSLDRISLEIIERNHGVEQVAIIGIHTGGVILAQRMRDKLWESEGVDVPLGHLDITLYRDDWSLISQNPVVRKTDIAFSLEDRHVVLVDDVIFTGRTIRAAMDAVMDYGRPRSMQLAVLVDRGGRELPIQPDYQGMVVRAGQGERVDVVLASDSAEDRVVVAPR
ncbi:MAG: bifunctional pyr operon transcriptional regulator/uracil phosphoribosyltransferase [Desulfobulbus propionicus]|nr:MAG: bifunctional pyr operon transcriptional regulator/uracil phosphoribosyltransferase [Desulfobulbus propionicus]